MKKKLVILGKVHDVGYRPFLLGIAESLEIERFFADNISIADKHAIHALVDSSKENVDSFIGIVSSKHPENASVEETKVEDYSGNVMKTENYYRYLTAMQLHKIATYGGGMLDKQDAMLGKQDAMLDKQDAMLDKQDAMLDKQDAMLDKQDETIKEIKGVREDVRGVREEVKNASAKQDRTNELLESRFNRMQEEIEKIKGALTRAGIKV